MSAIRSSAAAVDVVVTRNSAAVVAVGIRNSVAVDAHRRNRRGILAEEGATAHQCKGGGSRVRGSSRARGSVTDPRVVVRRVAVTRLAATAVRGAKHRWTVHAVRQAVTRWQVAVADAARVLAPLAAVRVAERAAAVVDAVDNGER